MSEMLSVLNAKDFDLHWKDSLAAAVNHLIKYPSFSSRAKSVKFRTAKGHAVAGRALQRRGQRASERWLIELEMGGVNYL